MKWKLLRAEDVRPTNVGLLSCENNSIREACKWLWMVLFVQNATLLTFHLYSRSSSYAFLLTSCCASPLSRRTLPIENASAIRVDARVIPQPHAPAASCERSPVTAPTTASFLPTTRSFVPSA